MLRVTLRISAIKKDLHPFHWIEVDFHSCACSAHIAVLSALSCRASISPPAPIKTERGAVTRSCGALRAIHSQNSSNVSISPATRQHRATIHIGNASIIINTKTTIQTIVSMSILRCLPLSHADSLPHYDDIRVLNPVDLRQLLVCRPVLRRNRGESIPGFHGVILRRAGPGPFQKFVYLRLYGRIIISSRFQLLLPVVAVAPLPVDNFLRDGRDRFKIGSRAEAFQQLIDLLLYCGVIISGSCEACFAVIAVPPCTVDYFLCHLCHALCRRCRRAGAGPGRRAFRILRNGISSDIAPADIDFSSADNAAVHIALDGSDLSAGYLLDDADMI